jgi:hypothetical protein
MPGVPNIKPEVYRSLKHNDIPKSVIESLGGIEDTIKPL